MLPFFLYNMRPGSEASSQQPLEQSPSCSLSPSGPTFLGQEPGACLWALGQALISRRAGEGGGKAGRAGVPMKERSEQLTTSREASMAGGDRISRPSAAAGDGRTCQLVRVVQALVPLAIKQTGQPFSL